jgi:ParB/RepB/Spo0J family partition protein
MTMEQTTLIPLQHLHESPFNPRRTFNEGALLEMADTMKPPGGGVLQPIVVRPLPGQAGDAPAQFEIVFGHRRTRAARLAELHTIPALVRDMTDAEVKRAQIVENLQREDVSAIEEADGLNALRHEHGASIEALMQQTGKSRRYVFNRLKLATAHEAVRQAVQQGRIGPELGQEVARVPNVLQPKALADVTYQEFREGQYVRVGRGVREAKNILAQRYQLSLAGAPFDILSIKLVPGVLACDACPRNSRNEPALADELGADVCTDPDCFAGKVAAHAAQTVAAAKKKGRPVVESDAAKELLEGAWDEHPEGYVRLTSLAFHEGPDEDQPVTVADALKRLGKKAPVPTLIVHPHRPNTVLDCITDAQHDAILKALGFAEEPDAPAAAPDARPRGLPAPDLTPLQQAVWQTDSWRRVLRAILQRVMVTARDRAELRLMAERELDYAGDFGVAEEVLGWNIDRQAGDAVRQRQAQLDAMSADQLAQLLVMVSIEQAPYGMHGAQERCSHRLALAERYGIHVLELSAEVTHA